MNNISKNWILTFLSNYKIPIVLILIGIFSVCSLVIAFNVKGKDYVTEIIRSFVNMELERIQQNYVTEMKKRDIQVQNLQSRLSVSENRYSEMKKRVDDVETKIKNRKPPETSDELRNRFIQLDIKPVN